MIAISYHWRPDNEFDMGLFETEEEAKAWLINELVEYRYVYDWYDDVEDKSYDAKGDIRKCMEKCTLVEIIEGSQNSGELVILMKER